MTISAIFTYCGVHLEYLKTLHDANVASFRSEISTL